MNGQSGLGAGYNSTEMHRRGLSSYQVRAYLGLLSCVHTLTSVDSDLFGTRTSQGG